MKLTREETAAMQNACAVLKHIYPLITEPFAKSQVIGLLQFLEPKDDSVHLAVQLDSPESRLMGDPSEDESLIACLCDDAAKLNQANPGDEMAATMLVAAARIEELQELRTGISSPTYRPNEQNAVQTEQPSLSDAEIVAAVRDVFSHGTEYTGLTFINSNGAEKPTAAARNLARALLSAQRQDSNMTFSGYFDEDEYQGITIEKFLKHRNESEGMDAWEIGHEFQVDAVYSRTEQWRVTNDVPWTAERIDCAAIANGAPK